MAISYSLDAVNPYLLPWNPTGGGSADDASFGLPSAPGTASSYDASDNSPSAAFSEAMVQAGPNAADGGAAKAETFVSSPETVTLAGSNLIFVNTYTQNVSQQYHDAITAAEHFIESNITSAVTINETFDTKNGGVNGFVGSNSFFFQTVSFATLKNALASRATTADDAAAISSMTVDVSGGAGYAITNGLAKALGIINPNQAGTDDTVFLNTADSYFFDQSAPLAGAFDAVSTLEDELTEAMGRIGTLLDSGATTRFAFGPLDLFRYSAAGVRDNTDGADGKNAFFSVDGNTLLIQFHNPISNGVNDGDDTGDWQITGDSFGFAVKGAVSPVSQTDLRVMDVLGWVPPAAAPPPQLGPPTPVVNLDTMPPGDFNHGGNSDTITLSTDGTLQILSTTNGAIAKVFNIGKVGTELTFGAVGQFFGANAASDFILRGPQGQTELFQITNDAIANVVQEGNIGTDFQIVSVGDYFQSGTSAFVTRSVNTGAMELYQLNNGLVTNAVSLGQVGSDQQVIGQGHFFNNGTEDLAFEQTGTGLLDLYQIRNGQIVGVTSLGAIGASQHIVGLGDFNGDHITDMLERGEDGSLEILEIGNGQVVGVSNLGQIGLEFQTAGVGDFFGNGTDDFMTRSGQLIELYKVQNYQLVGATTYATPPSTVQLAGAYFNHLV